MIQTIIMLTAAGNLVLITSFATTDESFKNNFIFKFCPLILALGLNVFGFARIMGWPV